MTETSEAIDDVWKKFGIKQPRPTVTFVIVGKRHHVRFFPMGPDANAERSGNCPAGLVIDGDITSPIAFDYFLQSHSGLLGSTVLSHFHPTSRVSHGIFSFSTESLHSFERREWI